MKKILLLLFVLTLLHEQHVYAAKSIWDGKKTDTSWYDESASEYHINSAAQFRGFADLVSYNNCSFEGKTIFLDCDIDLGSHPWSPIGLHSGKPFSGVFDGQNHSITNLLINSNQFDYPDMKDNVGLFGYAINAEIKNVCIQGFLEIFSGRYIGGVAAMVKRVENVYSDISIEIHTSLASSFIGTVAGNATDGVYSDISIEIHTSLASSFIGTVAGNATDGVRIYAKGGIRFTESYLGLNSGCSLGGIAGNCTNISECYSDVDVSVNIIGTTNQQGIGGISGVANNISNVLFTGQISIGNYNCNNDRFLPKIGGICGSLTKGDHLISAPDHISYGRGLATAKSVVVPSVSNATITDTYYINTWTTSNENYGVSITVDNLKSGNPLSGFDTTIWEFNQNEYPFIISLKQLIPKPTYTVTYYVDGVLYQVDEYKDGEAIVPPTDPIKEGYTFNGWDNLPSFINGNSLIVNGSFTINSYNITYMIENEVYKTITQEFHSYIYPPTTFPLKQGYLFGWGEYPEIVPAHDVTIEGYYSEDTYEYVDLGLPSGLLWATKNVGAACPEDYGYYFSWGETVLKESYYWGTYSHCNGSEKTLTKYCFSSEFGKVDNKYTLDETDDAVTTNWGKPWRLPSEAEAMELYSNCTWTLGNLNGISGCYVTGKNGNSIFLPKAGYKQYKTTFHKGQELYLLLSTLYTNNEVHPDYGLLIYCDANSYGLAGEERSFGFSARAVTSIDPAGINNLRISDSNEVERIYDVQGNILPKAKKGMNIIRMSNGQTRKVVVK